MTWNYRVISFKDESTLTGRFLKIQEVYYKKDGGLRAYAEAEVGGEDLDELRQDLEMQAKALSAPVINEEDFEEGKG